MTNSTLLLSSDSVLLSLLHQRAVLVLSTPSKNSAAENRHWQTKCHYSNQSCPINDPNRKVCKVCNELYIETIPWTSYLCLLDQTYIKQVEHFCSCCSPFCSDTDFMQLKLSVLSVASCFNLQKGRNAWWWWWCPPPIDVDQLRIHKIVCGNYLTFFFFSYREVQRSDG